ncbi:MAG TPA: class I SAM-dependent methyltransferase [Mycobacteriales bacterium]|nr:class I SAM-dependent methyltransferase [Mycobacteriales bacterium]
MAGSAPEAGPGWDARASLDELRAVIDPADVRGRKNRVIDLTQKRALRTGLGDVRGRRILDVGCGSGRITTWLRSAGAQVIGVEPSELMLRHARTLDRQLPVAVGVGQLPVRTGSVDAVVVVTVLQYLLAEPAEARKLGREVARVLRPGGRFVALEQVTAKPLGRGGAAEEYAEALAAGGLEIVEVRGVRVAASRAMRVALALPVPGGLAAAALMREARGWEASADPYAEVLFVARTRGP